MPEARSTPKYKIKVGGRELPAPLVAALREIVVDMEGRMSARESITGTASARKHAFWSTNRLIHYWRVMGSPYLAFPSKTSASRPRMREEVVAWLQTHFHPFGPLPGDILIVDTFRPNAHVCMLGSYNPETFELVTYEGNAHERAGAWR